MPEQLSLPYEPIEKVANRDFIRKNFTVSGRVTYKTPFKNLELRSGFNKRTVYEEIKELAEFIFTNGLPEPFTLDVLPDGRALIEQGHRRFKAINLLIEQGRFTPDNEVEFWPNKAEVTELQRMVNQFTSNNHQKPLLPIDQAAVAFDVKYNYGEELKNEKVAELFGVSRQTIDNLILLAKAPDDVKNQVRVGSMSFTDAVAFVRAQKKVSKEADKKEQESHETNDKLNISNKDPLAKEMEELADVEAKAEEFKKREALKEARDLERLLDVANEVLVNKESLIPHIGKRLAAAAYGEWTEDVANTETGEVSKIDRHQLLLGKDQEINDTAIDLLIANNAKSVYIYKVHTAAPSVFTDYIEMDKEDKAFDESRPEIKSIQDAIKAGDKIEAIVSKLDVPEQVKQDIAYQVHWLQKNLEDSRLWIHKHKQQNKNR